MSDPTELDELIGFLARSTRLSPSEARRVVDEVLSFLGETVDEFVRRRHRLLQAEGHPNTTIFGQIALEISRWRFRADPLTERQIRRLIYG